MTWSSAPPAMNSTPTAARPRYRACLLRPASAAAMIVTAPHTSHTRMKTMLLSMAASFGCAHFNGTSGWPGREEANVLAHGSAGPALLSLAGPGPSGPGPGTAGRPGVDRRPGHLRGGRRPACGLLALGCNVARSLFGTQH